MRPTRIELATFGLKDRRWFGRGRAFPPEPDIGRERGDAASGGDF